MELLQEARELLGYMQQFRHELHMYPELSMQEYETTDRIERELNKLGLQCVRFEPTGLYTQIRGDYPGKTVALRADIDALPITEETGLEFASRRPGVMHACGHDVHAAMLLGAAKLLLAHREEIHGTVRLLFQPSEETGTGSSTIIAQGAAEGVDYFFGQHIREFVPCGTISGIVGPQLAGAESFSLRVIGAAHHAGMPHMADGVDVTVIASEIVLALQTIVSRHVNPADPAVVSIGQLHSGTRGNIISGEAVMDGTIRYYEESVRELIKEQMTRLVMGIAQAHGAQAEIEWGQNIWPVVNDEFVTRIALGAAEKITGVKQEAQTGKGTMGAEDFGAYSRCGRACFLTVGVGGHYPGHSPKLEVDENAMPYGCAMLVQTAIDLLNAEGPNA